MEYWDIYDANKQRTGRTMKRNDWCLKDGEYHLSVLGVVARPDGRYLITKKSHDTSLGTGLVGGFRREPHRPVKNSADAGAPGST